MCVSVCVRVGFGASARSGYLGNPYFYAAWKDETANMLIKKIAQKAHAFGFEARVIAVLEEAASRKRVLQ